MEHRDQAIIPSMEASGVLDGGVERERERDSTRESLEVCVRHQFVGEVQCSTLPLLPPAPRPVCCPDNTFTHQTTLSVDMRACVSVSVCVCV